MSTYCDDISTYCDDILTSCVDISTYCDDIPTSCVDMQVIKYVDTRVVQDLLTRLESRVLKCHTDSVAETDMSAVTSPRRQMFSSTQLFSSPQRRIKKSKARDNQVARRKKKPRRRKRKEAGGYDSFDDIISSGSDSDHYDIKC